MYIKESGTISGNLHYYRAWLSLGCILVGVIIYLSLIPKPPKLSSIPDIDKIEHLLAYGVLMGWFSQIYLSRVSRIIWAVIFCLMGISLEIIQGLMGHRYFEYADMLANTAGVFLGLWISSRYCVGWLARLDRAMLR